MRERGFAPDDHPMRNNDDRSGAEPDEMNALIDAELAERILTGEAVAPPRLHQALRAAAAPPDRHDVVGEEAAVRMFRLAQEHRTARTGPGRAVVGHRAGAAVGRARRPAWTRGAIKIAAAFFVLTAGGVAVAAGVSAISDPLPQGSARPAGSSYGSPRDTGPGGPGQLPTPGPHGSTLPDAFGLCQGFRAEAVVDLAAAGRNPRYAQLIAVAGGLDKVTAYCETEVVRPAATDHPAHPTSRPSAPPEHPTPTPAKHPQGEPSPDHKPAPASQTQG